MSPSVASTLCSVVPKQRFLFGPLAVVAAGMSFDIILCRPDTAQTKQSDGEMSVSSEAEKRGLRAYRRSGDSGMGSSAGKNTSPCPGGESGVPGSDSRWRPVSEDCLVMI